ncbi:porphyrin biosynthesis protein [Morganella morganii]|uniref:cobaltochelatase CobT-related protein n=1 Tax=Morganella morganii TaxID=582 RepID=UPI0021D0CBD4|nr:porphyrin biosynthesis protein [Morganella morganii]MCU6236732.1 porphyrin biosynthesis protein [Morganella morganii]
MAKKSGIRDEVLSFRESVQTVVSLLSSKKIRVVDYGTKAYCAYNKKSGELEYINIPSIPDTASDALLNAIRGFIDHEVAHVLFTDQPIAKLLDGKKAFHVWNVIEDTFIERKMALMFPGSRKNLIKTQQHIINSFFGKNIKDLINACGSDTRKLFLEVFLMPVSRALCGHTPFIDFMEPYWDWFESEMAIMDSFNYRTRINRITKSEGAAKLAADLIKAFRVADEKKAAEKEDKKKLPDPSKEKSEDVKPGDEDGESTDAPEPVDEKSKDKAEKTTEDDKASDEEIDKDGEDFDTSSDTSLDTSDDTDNSDIDTLESDKPDSDKPDDTPDPDDTAGIPDKTDDRESEAKPDSDEKSSGEPSDEKSKPGSGEASGGGAGDEPDHLDIGGDDPAETPISDSESGTGGSEESTDSDEGESLSENDKRELESDDAPETLSTEDAATDMISEEIKSVGASRYRPITRSNDFTGLLENAYDFIKDTPKKLGDGVSWAVESRDYIFNEKRGLALFRRDVEPRMSAKSHTLSKDLERAIASKNRVQKVNGLRRGRVNSSSLWKVAVPAIDDDRVFFKKHDHKAVNAAVQLVIDLSGSMGGSRIEIATAAAYVLSDALDKIKIPNMITGFTTAGCMSTSATASRYEPLFMPTLKNWNEKANSSICMARLGSCTGSIPLANNADGESILALAQHHNGRTEDKQIMMALSDGAPCAAGRGFSGHLVDVLDFISKKTAIDILAVGIQSSAPAHYYKHHTEVHSVDDLPNTVITAIRNLLLTGKAGF